MSDSLVHHYRDMAAGGQSFRGLSILQHRELIGKLIRRHRARTVLDFGCGAGDAYRQPHRLFKDWGLRWTAITLYDPAFEEHDRKPVGRFDAVLCSDVLEHVPEEEVDAFIDTLFGHARVLLWASVCCRPAKKTLPDGETNLHCTLRPFDWWSEKFAARAAATGITAHLVETP